MALPKPRKDRHHYLPKFYLRGFTLDGGERDRLYEFDRERSKLIPSSPRKSAHIRRFYEVDLGGARHPDFVEDRFGDSVEPKCAAAVRDALAAEMVPCPAVAIELASLVALLAIRVPYARRQRAAFDDRMSKDRLRKQLSTDEGYAEFVRISLLQIAAQGREPTQEERALIGDREGMRRNANSDDYEVTLDQTSHVQWMIRDLLGLTFLLGQRDWTIIRTDEAAPDLITSDVPVIVTRDESSTLSAAPSFSDRDSIVLLPLTRRVLLQGTFGIPSTPCSDFSELVLRTNGLTLARATKAFAATEDFKWVDSSGRRRNAQSWLSEPNSHEFQDCLDFVVMKWGDVFARLAAS